MNRSAANMTVRHRPTFPLVRLKTLGMQEFEMCLLTLHTTRSVSYLRILKKKTITIDYNRHLGFSKMDAMLSCYVYIFKFFFGLV